MAMTNAVDDELIASINNALHLKLLNNLWTDFDIEGMGIAHWYLQGRLLLNEDYSVVFDQFRYMSLIATCFLPQHDNKTIAKEEKEKFSSPLPTTFVATKKDLFNRPCQSTETWRWIRFSAFFS